MAKRKKRETFGQVEKLPSGRYRARYTGPDGQRHAAPTTFDTMGDARTWLTLRHTDVARGEWQPPVRRNPVAFAVYAREQIDTRTSSRGEHLKPRTRVEYLRLLDGPLALFKDDALTAITTERVRRWYKEQTATGHKTQTARAYQVLKSVLATAVADGRITSNPCQVRGAVKASTGKRVEPPTDAELAIIVASIDQRFALAVGVAAWGGLRYGELTELRRGDITFVPGIAAPDAALLSITRAVSHTADGGDIVGPPKSAAGVRTIALPDTLTDDLRARLAEIAATDDALVFPSLSDPERHLSSGSFSAYWRRARAAAGRPDMPFHALRHYGATRYAIAGATTKELMRRMGHNDLALAMRYQHEAGRDAELVARMGATR
ncbi:site-specific integrase [Humibacter antri]